MPRFCQIMLQPSVYSYLPAWPCAHLWLIPWPFVLYKVCRMSDDQESFSSRIRLARLELTADNLNLVIARNKTIRRNEAISGKKNFFYWKTWKPPNSRICRLNSRNSKRRRMSREFSDDWNDGPFLLAYVYLASVIFLADISVLQCGAVEGKKKTCATHLK